ncbi:uncharacterized protein BT62DRAFT_1003043 [Guyanagaster necrorhizus]|uniref:Methyltransferase domain-containing protein n=1 Tax=Guyanagaster necrorhizus TaxID=856835 RepID=A0A9P7VXP1_9AGAR|nr:uncharacterized protein BT62DRAFT_1003043 [Guyanagaster necrorhizus MCA 3950]KAG7449461.1 hypothetical protein BT62DRAFT_1003043 [Guyanagaster necrorhizus MCA 3950]
MSSRAASGRRRLQSGNTSSSKSKQLKATTAASTEGHAEKSFLSALRPLRPTGSAQYAPPLLLTSPMPSTSYAPGPAPQPVHTDNEDSALPPSPMSNAQPRSPLGLVPPLSSVPDNTLRVLSPLRKDDNIIMPTPPPPLLESWAESSDSGSVTSDTSSHSSMDVNAPTSYFSHSSGSTDSQPTASPSSFVFPSSRSRAHPSSPPPKFKLKPKKDKGKQVETRVHPVVSDPPHSQSPEPYTSILGSSGSSSKSLSPHSHNSTEVGSSFVFPLSRSRAHPSSPPPMLKLPLKKKSRSSANSDRHGDSHRRFMGIPLNRKKKPSQDQSADTASDLSASDPSSSRPSSVDTTSYIGSTSFSIDPQWASTSSPSKRDSYPLDPYDSILLEQDRLGTGLLKHLNSVDGPSFHHYGNNPPATVLDLGCGEGHWMLDAAVAWKGYGTKVTGFDMVDITKSLRAAAAQNGVSENISFVKGHFLKNELPFPSDSFDLVRMSNLTYAIPFEKWEFVLREACRVLTVGGRLELIDDHVFFPYGKPALPTAPLDESSDADSLARYSQLHPDSDRVDPITEEEEEEEEEEDYDVEEEEASDTATLNGKRHDTSLSTPTSGPSNSVSSSLLPAEFHADPWTDQASAARELESLFEHLHNTRYEIHLCPSQFIVEMLQEIFGHSREVRTMHLTLAPPDPGPEKGRPPDEVHQLTHAPGLMLWPSTLIPLPRTEIEVHALKHPRVLLSLKAALMSYAVEIAEEDDVDEEVVRESLWDYEGFLHERFNPPQYIHGSVDHIPQATSYTRQDSDNRSTRDSIFSVGSLSSEGRSAMQEYQSELRDHLAWSLEDTRVSPPPRQHIPHPQDDSHTRTAAPSILTLPSFATVSPTDATAPPDYSRYEPTHVRTFHVFEAIKMDETLLGAAI